jgi:hypothetical protein
MAKKSNAKSEAEKNVKALLSQPAGEAVDPSEAEYAAAEEADASDADATGEAEYEAPKRARAGAWMSAQKPPESASDFYQLVTLSKPRRWLHAKVPAECVRFTRDDQGNKVLVFDGVKCPRGVVTYHGVKCYLDGGPKASPDATEISLLKERLAALEAKSRVFEAPASLEA